MKSLFYLALGCLIFSSLQSCKKENEDPENKEPDEMMLSIGYGPAWSPDGTMIAFISNDSLFTIHPDGSEKNLLTTEAYGDLTWSPSGNYLLYSRFYLGFFIYRINPDGSDKINISGEIASPGSPAWSHNGEQITFTGLNDKYASVLYIVNKDGTGLKILTTVADLSPFQIPWWSGDGTTILFSGGNENERDIYLTDYDGSNLRKLQIPSLYEEYALFTPNGQKILFSASGNIYQVNPDGSGLVNLTGTTGNNAYPVPSPDGKLIAFYSYRDVEDGLYIMALDGSNTKKLSGPGVSSTEISWSPDSRKIVFSGHRAIQGDVFSTNIYVVNLPE